MTWNEKMKYFADYIRKNVPNEENFDSNLMEESLKRKDWLDLYPIVSDTDDITAVINRWAKDTLFDNEYIYIEYFDDNNCGLIRVMKFSVEVD